MLSDEDKRRIEEEEAYRAKVRASQKPPEPAPTKKASGCGCGSMVALLAVGIILVVVIGSSISSRSTSSRTAPRDTTPSFDSLLSASPDNVASVDFTSDPAGAQLTIGGRSRGTTPLTIRVPARRAWSYTLRVPNSAPNHDLYHSYSGTLNVSEDTAISVWIERLNAEEVAALRARQEEEAARARALEEERERELEAQRVYYKVESNCGRGVDITMSNADWDTAQYGNQSNAFSYWMIPRTGAFLYLSAQNQCDSGYVTVRFVQDGKVLRENTSRGAYVIATISGRW